MTIARLLGMSLLVATMAAMPAYGNPGNGNGANNANNENNGNDGNQGNHGNSQASQSSNRPSVETQQARGAAQADRSRQERNIPERQDRTFNTSRNNNSASPNLVNRSRGRGAEHRNERALRTNDMLASFERARWSSNPHDDRGQGNRGVVNMRDPFGFDKASGREGAERGRPFAGNVDDQGSTDGGTPPPEEPPVIEPALLNLEEDLAFNWETENEMVASYQSYIDYYNGMLESGTLQDSQVWLFNYYISYYQGRVDYYNSLDHQRVYLRGDATIDYSIDLAPPEGFEETTLTITTSLVVSESFTTYTRTWNSETGTWDYTPVHYEAGTVIDTVEEQAVISADSATYDFSYDPAGDLLIGNEWNYDGGFFDVVVEVTDTSTESSYTQTFDRSLYLYRDPYGKVTDSLTGEAIVNAKVTVFDEDGSIVALDKASNSIASNPQTTDATGRYAFNLRANKKYYMMATAPGYEDHKSKLFTEGWHVIREDIELTPKAETLLSNER